MRLALLIVAACLLAVPASADAAKRKVPQGFFGATWDSSAEAAPAGVQDRQWALMASSGVESVRVAFSWAVAQPAPGRPFDFTRTDQVVAQATRRGLEVLPVVIEAPAWAKLHPGRYGSRPRRVADYTAYLRALVERYGARGSFWRAGYPLPHRPIRHWQIWNEPHSSNFWYARKSRWAHTYVSLLKSSYRTVKTVDRRSKVVLAGLTNASWNQLKAIYRRKARRYFDIVGSQVYTKRVRDVFLGTRLVRNVMRNNGDRRKPLWITEASWPAAHGRVPGIRKTFPFATTDRVMAKRVRQFLAGAVRARRNRRIRLGRAFWYSWATPYTTNYAFSYSGLLQGRGSNFVAKPALRSYRTAARRYEGCVKTAFGRCR